MKQVASRVNKSYFIAKAFVRMCKKVNETAKGKQHDALRSSRKAFI